jgi:hypothetical protein
MNQQISTAALKKGAITRSKNAANTNKSEGKGSELSKRKAEGSPSDKTLKRSAFGDITNVSNILPNMNSSVFHINIRIYVIN